MRKKGFIIDGTVLEKYKGKEENVIIPDGITIIGRSAFGGSDIISVDIPNSVKCIEDSAFIGSNIASIVIPNSVTRIESNAFRNCKKLQSVKFCGEIKQMGERVFSECSQLNEFEFPTGLTVIPSGTFDGSGLKRIIIPNSVTIIASQAFFSCSLLTSIELPNNLIRIDKSAFEWSGIENISIPNGVTYISDKAFKGSSLKTVDFHDGITGIGEEAFCGCGALKSVKLNKGLRRIGPDAFRNCGFKKVKIPNSVEEIGRDAFYKSSPSRRTKNPTLEITVPRSVEKINIYGFVNKSDTLIKCYENSLAHELAIRDNIKYELIG